MKKTFFNALVIFSLLSVTSSICCAQTSIFSFNTSSTLLDVTTDQSPAHWYIEIYSAVNVDTTLRWKVHFNRTRPEWKIGFDDQSNRYDSLITGDSADFTLFANPSVVQKLVISNTLNNTAGTGDVLFEIYDPQLPQVRDTIVYQFEVSEGLNSSVNSVRNEPLNLKQNDKRFVLNKFAKRGTYHLYDLNGKLIDRATFTGNEFSVDSDRNAIFILKISTGQEQLSRVIRL